MGAQERMPAGTLRRATGIDAMKRHVLRSRPGSTLLYAVGAHSLYRFADARFQGVGTQLFKNGVSIEMGFNGSRLRFMRMPPTVGVVDYLFVTGGEHLVKVDAAGAVSKWGIDAPTTNPAAADNGAGALAAGTYKYWITFKNTVTGHRSNSNPVEATVTIGASRQVLVSNIPTSTDPQVGAREVWRTVVGGVVGFLLTTIPDNVATTYVDNTADAGLGSTQLPTDNDPPNQKYNRVAGPYYGRAFWAGIDIDGQRGRIVFSPAGRPESDSGFLDVTNDDDPTREIVLWNGSLWVFTEGKIIQILGTDEPFAYRDVYGAPGTNDAESVCPTPYGIVYKANDGLRLFNGSQSLIAGEDSVRLIFQGEALEGIGPIGTAVSHAYGRGEYYVSDGVATIVVNLADNTWRNLGLALDAVFYEPDTKEMVASFSGKTLLLEAVGATTDDGAAVSFEVESPAVLSDISKPALLQRIFIEANTRSQWLTPRVRLIAPKNDGSDEEEEVVLTLSQLQSATRQTQELPVLRSGRLISIRLTGSLSDQVEVYGIEADVDIGVEPIVTSPVVGEEKGVVPLSQAQSLT